MRIITDEREIKEHIRVLNACRRNLTNAQKREIIKAQLLDHPEYADRHVAGMLFVDNHTVSAVRGELESNGEIPVVTQVVAKNGNVYKRLPVMVPKPRAAERMVSALGRLDPSVTGYVSGSHLCDTPVQLHELAAQPADIQRRVVEKLESGSHRRVKRLARQAKKDLRLASCSAPDYDGSFDLDTVKQADIVDLAANLSLPAECADLFIADPPWDHGAVQLYGAAARLAQHVLKPGGCAALLTGKAHLDEVIAEIEPYLEWRWMLAEFQPESEQRCYPLPVFSKFRPTLVFWKPGPALWTEFIPDASWTPKEKDFHPWQQSSQTMRLIMSAMTPVGGLVIDPMVGGGTVPAVAKALGRHFIGFDKDPEAVAITLERLNGTEFGSDLTTASAETAGMELTA